MGGRAAGPSAGRVVVFVECREDAAARWALERLLDGSFGRVEFASSAEAAGRSEDAPVVIYGADAAGPPRAPTLHIRPDRRLWDRYLQPDSLPGHPLPRVNAAGCGLPLVLPFGTADDPGSTAAANLRSTSVDLVASTFYWLGYYAEALAAERDPFGRVPETALPTVREGTETRPHVDEYREVFCGWMAEIGVPANPPGRAQRAWMTHDVDSCLGRGRPPRVRAAALRALARETLRHRAPWTGVQLAVDELAAAGDRTPPHASLARIAARDRRLGLASHFYLMANGSHRHDADYDIAGPAARAALAALAVAGVEVGLHVGLGAFADSRRLRGEWERLAEVLGHPPRGARCHYLAVRSSRTFRLLDRLGCVHDSSMGFASRCGFRGGTTRPYPLFDLQDRRPLELIEYPLAIMDKALLTMPTARRRRTVDEVVRQVRRHGGCLVVDWHNVHHGSRHLRALRTVTDSLSPTGR
jgi:hypothetical protein